MVFAAWQRPGEKTEKQIHCKGPGDCHKPEMKWPLLGRTRKKEEIRDNPASQTLKPRLPPWPQFLRACERSLGHCFPPDSLKHQGKPERGVKCSAWVAVHGYPASGVSNMGHKDSDMPARSLGGKAAIHTVLKDGECPVATRGKRSGVCGNRDFKFCRSKGGRPASGGSPIRPRESV